MKYKRTLITGGKGLVGSALQSDFKPTMQDVDLLNFDSIVNYITENQIDSIIHCAAKVGGIKANAEHLADFYTENITMNSNLLQAAHQCGVEKVVSFMSTCVFPDDAVYPLTPDQIHNGEPHPSNYAYAYAKRMVEVQSRAYREQYDCNFVTVIPCNIYGPNDNFNLESGHVIPSLIHKCYLANNDNTNFEIWGTGKAYREFIYSNDVGYIAQWALENYDDSEPLIISPDEEINIAIIAQEIAWRMGFEGNIIYNQELDGQIRKPSDNSKLKSLLPNFNFTPIEEGLQKSIDWFVENYDEARK
jgi:GDP-L-fucose synthase